MCRVSCGAGCSRLDQQQGEWNSSTDRDGAEYQLRDQFLPLWKAIVSCPPERPARTVIGRRSSAVRRLRVFSKYADDEANTRSETVLLMLVGGNRISGIHGAHFGPGVHIRFAVSRREAADHSVGRIQKCEHGRMSDLSSVPNHRRIRPRHFRKFEMECVDCHNRPTHTFDLPERAMDKALARR